MKDKAAAARYLFLFDSYARTGLHSHQTKRGDRLGFHLGWRYCRRWCLVSESRARRSGIYCDYCGARVVITRERLNTVVGDHLRYLLLFDSTVNAQVHSGPLAIRL